MSLISVVTTSVLSQCFPSSVPASLFMFQASQHFPCDIYGSRMKLKLKLKCLLINNPSYTVECCSSWGQDFKLHFHFLTHKHAFTQHITQTTMKFLA